MKNRLAKNCVSCKALNGQSCILGYSTKQKQMGHQMKTIPTEECPKPTTDKMLNKIQNKLAREANS